MVDTREWTEQQEMFLRMQKYAFIYEFEPIFHELVWVGQGSEQFPLTEDEKQMLWALYDLEATCLQYVRTTHPESKTKTAYVSGKLWAEIIKARSKPNA